MAAFTIEELDEGSVSRLRARADANGHSLEAEAAAILRGALGNEPRNWGQHLLDTIRAEWGPFGNVELDIPARQAERDPPRFEDW
jgi:plasmid stability protein